LALEKLEQRTTPEAVLPVVRRAILDGTFAPGSPLREAQIATELGISRPPLREALSKLEEEGLVVKVPFRGAYVAEVGPKDIEEIAQLRVRLEPFAIERSLPWLTGAGSGSFLALVDELQDAADANDVARCIDTHLAIHRMIYEAADHKLLLRLWNAWEWQLRLFLAVDLRAFIEPAEVAAKHHELYRVIQTGDLVAIDHEIRRHVHGADETSLDPAVRESSKPTT